MELLQQLGVALGFASLAGLNLYLTVLVAGVAIRYGWVDLAGEHQNLLLLGSPWIIGVAGALFVLEFFADKIPWVDSSWDVLHTLLRPAGGVFLALGALGSLDSEMTVIAGLLAGGATLSTHGLKASGRMLINLSPEPVSNSVASFAEDGLVLGGLSLMALAPALAFFVFLVFCIVAAVVTVKLWKVVGRGLIGLRERWGSSPQEVTGDPR